MAKITVHKQVTRIMSKKFHLHMNIKSLITMKNNKIYLLLFLKTFRSYLNTYKIFLSIWFKKN